VQNFLENSAKRPPQQTALICGEERSAWGKADHLANRIAWFLHHQGIERQDRVAILLDKFAASVISLFRFLKADAIFLMLGESLKASKLAQTLNDCQVKALIALSPKPEAVLDALDQATTVEFMVRIWGSRSIPSSRGSSGRSHSLSDALQYGQRNSRPKLANIDLDLSRIICTSGSTRGPEGVMRTHLNMVSAATWIIGYLEKRRDDIIMNVLPLSLDCGLYQVLMAFRFGGTVLLERSFNYPYQIIQKAIQEKVTGFSCVPRTNFALLLSLKNLEKSDFSSRRYIRDYD